MNVLKIGVVEDELIIAESIRTILENCDYLVIEPVTNYDEAINLLNTQNPDLMLLDINLKGKKDGIDIAQIINEQYKIPFIFLTANADTNSINRAKETKPLAYLLKPFQQENIFAAIEICLFNYTSLQKKVEFLFVKEKNAFLKIVCDEIFYIESSHVYILIHTIKKTFTIRKTLQEIIQDLNPEKFVKVHRSYIVNVDHIELIKQDSLTINNKFIPISKSYYDDLNVHLKLKQ